MGEYLSNAVKMSLIKVRKIGITDIETDAIVNAANVGLQEGGSVCGAIFKAAGRKELQDACDMIGHCDTGKAVITPGFNSRAKYIIHAVGPIWQDGKHHEPQLLYSAYQSAMTLAIEKGCRSIAFPLISAGIFGYPKEAAIRKAIQAVRDFMKEHEEVSIEVILTIPDEETCRQAYYALEDQAREYVAAGRDNWKIKPMPDKKKIFSFERPFTKEEMQILKRGHVPRKMEDKWFWYMDGNTLYAHRSWTGFCIYIVNFGPRDMLEITVNNDPKQYSTSDEYDEIRAFNRLLNWWTGSNYDYYGEWLMETSDAILKTKLSGKTLIMNGDEVDAVFFHKPEEPEGFLSNWYPAKFEIDGFQFTSSEQYIMYKKCMIFGDKISAKKVLATDDPAEQQKIGRNASGYISDIWAGCRQMVAYEGLMAKFSQNKGLRVRLLGTNDAVLVECAGSDKVWACGLRLDDIRRYIAKEWTGTNILGFTLMAVRSCLREALEEELQPSLANG